MRSILTAVLLMVAAPALAQEPETIHVPFSMPILEGWRTETIRFPLSFAPSIPYRGIEELRFAPGMFTAESPEYWTYAFVWWVQDGTKLNLERIERDLEAYFRGLTNAVSEGQFDASKIQHRAMLRIPKADPMDGPDFVGRVQTFDAFVKRAAVELLVRGRTVHCKEKNHYAVFFELSPQPMSHPVWEDLNSIRAGFSCD